MTSDLIDISRELLSKLFKLKSRVNCSRHNALLYFFYWVQKIDPKISLRTTAMRKICLWWLIVDDGWNYYWLLWTFMTFGPGNAWFLPLFWICSLTQLVIKLNRDGNMLTCNSLTFSHPISISVYLGKIIFDSHKPAHKIWEWKEKLNFKRVR